MPIPDPLAARASAFKSSFRPPAISIPVDARGHDADVLATPSPTLVPQWPLIPGASGPQDTGSGPSPPTGATSEPGSAGAGSPAMTNLGALWKYLDECDDPRRKKTNLQVLALQPDDVLAAYASRVQDRAISLLINESVEYQRARALRVMDFGPSPTKSGHGLWALQAHDPTALSQPLLAGVPTPAQQQQAPSEPRQDREQQSRSQPAAAEVQEEKPLRSRLRGAKRKAGVCSGATDGEGSGFPAELFKSPAERNSSLDRRRVVAPTLRSMR